MSDAGIYWDSCVFISLLQQTKDRYEALAHIEDEAKEGKYKIVTSMVTLAEVSRAHGEGVIDDVTSEKLLDYFENDYIVLRSVDRPTGREAHKLARQLNIMPLDAIHLAAAVRAGVPMIHTYDSKKHRRKGLLKWNGKIGTPPISIVVPPDPPKNLLTFAKPVELPEAASETPAAEAGT